MTSLPEVPTEELLNFQDFPTSNRPQNLDFDNPIQIDIKSSNNDDDFNKLPDVKEENKTSNEKSFWTLEYYQQFFDVDTDEVIQRLIASINPRNVLGVKLDNKPDLYGPFWVTVTLIFTIAVSGNMAKYLQEANVHYHWKYDFHLVSYAATAIITYICLVPTAIWFLLKWSLSDLASEETNIVPNILKMMCLYGYSLFIFIPTSVLLTIQVPSFQWSLVVFSAVLSGSVLLIALFPSLKLSRHKLFFALGIISCHFLLALTFILIPNHSVAHSLETVSTKAPLTNVTKIALHVIASTKSP